MKSAAAEARRPGLSKRGVPSCSKRARCGWGQSGRRSLITRSRFLAPGNYIPDFIPGVKVALFHGYAIQKRIEAVDDHFTVRGWFDIYCTQGPSSTPYFKELEKKYGFFRVYETGWPKADTYFSPEVQRKPQNDHPVILYPPTFTRNVCSAPHLMAEIDRLAKTHPWDWVITFHPKLTDPGS